jgi:2-methylcitrate dehydratase PrpD
VSTNEGRVERIIAQSCARFINDPIPDGTRRGASTVILDWLGCVLIGAESPAAKAIAKAYAPDIGSGPATCFVGPSACSADLAALISGTVGHVMELDDIYSPAMYHPAVGVISAALAASQMAQVSGDRFIRAVIAGYEVSNRIGAAINPEHYKYWHTTGTVGTIGAAMASAVVLGLNEAQCGYAIAHATTMAAGLQQAFRSDGMTKPLHAGHAAQSGLMAARLASADFVGSSEMLTGPIGLVTVMSHGRDIAPGFDDLLKVWTIERATFKRFSNCGHTFAGIDATLDMMDEAPISPGEVERIDVGGYQATVDVAAIANPTSPFEARFSTQFGVAATLLGHNLMDPTTFDRLYADPAVHALMKRIHISLDPVVAAAAPRLRGANVRIKLKSGGERALFLRTRKGDPDNPMTSSDLQEKFLRLVGATRHRDRTTALMQWVRELPALAKLTTASLPLEAGEGAKLRAV